MAGAEFFAGDGPIATANGACDACGSGGFRGRSAVNVVRGLGLDWTG
jgi:hypothetical protein